MKSLVNQKRDLIRQHFGVPAVPTDFDRKLAAFLKQQRGELSFAQFSKKTALPSSTLFRLERCEQSITLGRLHGLMKKLKVTLADIFGK